MRKHFLRSIALLLLLGGLLAAAPARAQSNYQSWVSSGGNDGSSCARNAPCATFSVAINKTVANGTVFCSDSGAFQGFYLNKSLTIDCSDNVGSNQAAGGGAGSIVVELAAGDRVMLRGLHVSFREARAGIFTMLGAGALTIDRSVIIGGNSQDISPVAITPAGAAKVTIADSLISGGGGTSTGAGIRIYPNVNGTAQVTIRNSKVTQSVFGIAVDGTRSTGGINATIVNSLMSDNVMDGLIATTSAGGAPIGVTVSHSQSLNNGYGIRSIGSNVTVRLKDTEIVGNGVGLSGGGAILSAGSNLVQANGANGGFTGAVPLN